MGVIRFPRHLLNMQHGKAAGGSQPGVGRDILVLPGGQQHLGSTWHRAALPGCNGELALLYLRPKLTQHPSRKMFMTVGGYLTERQDRRRADKGAHLWLKSAYSVPSVINSTALQGNVIFNWRRLACLASGK